MPGTRAKGTHRSPWRAVIVVALLVTTGCGRGKYPVEGKVVYKDGTPCTGGMIIFEPLDNEVKTSSRRHIQKDGSFFLSTDNEMDGVPEGRYRVAIMPLIGVSGASGTPINGKYWSPATSPLEYTVIRG